MSALLRRFRHLYQPLLTSSRRPWCFAAATVLAGLGSLPGLTPVARAQQEVSVDQFTGTAHVGIPLASLEIKGIPLAVSLNYAAMGMQVNDQGDPVGVGWAFGGIPSISRQVRGLPDDYQPLPYSADPLRYGWLTPQAQVRAQSLNQAWPGFTYPLTVSSYCGTTQEQQAVGVVEAFESQRPVEGAIPGTMWDSEPDIFSYAVPGHAGRFVFDNTGQARTMPFDPIKITYSNTLTDSLGTGINSFTISTPEGNTYQFNEYDVTHKQSNKFNYVTQTGGSGMVMAAPTLFQREFYYYLLDKPATYATTWYITAMQNPAGEQIAFSYLNIRFHDSKVSREPSSINISTPSGRIPQYSWTVRRNKATLASIISPTAFIRFTQTDTLTYNQFSGTAISAVVSGYRTPRGNTVVKSVNFDYDRVKAVDNPFPTGTWAGPNGEITPFYYYNTNEYIRSFLRTVRINTACGAPLAYNFKYHSLTPFATVACIPPITGGYHDYWGYLRFDVDNEWFASGESGPILFNYSALSPQSVPGAPMRLYPSPGAFTAGISADYQLPSDMVVPAFSNAPNPAGETNFERSTLLGTLEEVRLPTGGRISLTYEPHQFHDPAIDIMYNPGNTYIGPGVRVRTVSYTDNVSGVSQNREYRYKQSDGKSSGRLLWLPIFGFQRPFSANYDFVVDNINSHPFEDRDIGYGRVTEVVSGRGETVTSFAIDGAADAVTSDPSNSTGSAPGSNLPVWQRSATGPARSTGACSAFATSFTPGYDTYPFSPSTNYDFWRGQVLSVINYAEPIGTAAPVAVRSTTYKYKYRNLAPNASPVVGWAYDGVSKSTGTGNGTTATGPRAFVVARYQLLTDFQLAVDKETTEAYTQSPASISSSSSTRYAYNSQGRLAMVVKLTSDGGLIRTRYKYITDYNLPGTTTSTDASLQALVHRMNQEHLTADLLETITEVVLPNTTGTRLAGITLNTFRQDVANGPTRPYQTLRWQVATPLIQYPSDTTKMVGQDWQVSSRLRAETTFEEIGGGSRQIPITVSQRAGGAVNSLHLGYNTTVPVLQIANAYASEARFSNFEEMDQRDLTYAWQVSSTGATRLADAARTGGQGMRLNNQGVLSTPLPAPAAGSQLPPVALGLRLSCWVRVAVPGTAAGQLTVQVSSGSPIFSKAVAVAGGSLGWQFVEVPVNLSSLNITPTNRQSFTMSISNTGGQLVDVDDVLLLPSTATAQSITYSQLLRQKSSETDARGQTTYYEYTSAGRLRTMRDHQGNLVRRVEQVLGGQNVDESTLGFTITSNKTIYESFMEGTPITFTPFGLCSDLVSYQWSFGCAGATPCTSTDAIPTFQYPVSGQPGDYTITLQATTPNGVQTSTQSLHLVPPPPQPLQYYTCTAGSISLSPCGNNGPALTCASLPTPPANLTMFKVNVTGAASNITYQWEMRLPDSAQPSAWRDGADPQFTYYVSGGQGTNTLSVGHGNHPMEFRCRVNYTPVAGGSGSGEEIATSPDFFIEVRTPSGTCN